VNWRNWFSWLPPQVSDMIPGEKERRTSGYKDTSHKKVNDTNKSRYAPVYDIAAEVVQERLSRSYIVSNEGSFSLALLSNSLASIDTLVVTSEFDSPETVLSWGGIPHTMVTLGELENMDLLPSQTLIVSCTDHPVPKELKKKVLEFVREGGQLLTADRSLSSWISNLFPEFLTSRSEQERIQVRGVFADVKIPKNVSKHSLIRDIIIDEPDNLLWTIENFTDIVAKRNSQVEKLLVASKLRWSFNEDGVLYYFKYGNGRVYHSLPHFFVSQYDPWPHYLNALPLVEDYLKSKNVSERIIELTRKYYKDLGPQFVTLSALRTTITTLEFLSRVIATQKKDYNPVIIIPAPVETAPTETQSKPSDPIKKK